MSMTDPLSDMLTRIRNAQMAIHDSVSIPHSRLKEQILRLLETEGFVSDVVVEGEVPNKNITLQIKYVGKNKPLIRGLRKISTPGRRTYVGKAELPKSLGGLGTIVVSTSQGILTDRECRNRGIGGEVLCEVW